MFVRMSVSLNVYKIFALSSHTTTTTTTISKQRNTHIYTIIFKLKQKQKLDLTHTQTLKQYCGYQLEIILHLMGILDSMTAGPTEFSASIEKMCRKNKIEESKFRYFDPGDTARNRLILSQIGKSIHLSQNYLFSGSKNIECILRSWSHNLFFENLFD